MPTSTTFYQRDPMRSYVSHAHIAITDTGKITGYYFPADERPTAFYALHLEAEGVDVSIHLTDPEVIGSLSAALDHALKHITEQEDAA